MTSPAKIASNARNAKKSTGPRTLIGRNSSRLNRLKHGMCAAIALLPDEDPAMFKERIIEWVTYLRPRNHIELYLAERAVYLSWQLDRASRAQSASVCLKAFTAAADREDRVQQEVDELTHRLFRTSRERTNALPQPESQRGRPGNPWPGTIDDAEHPARLVAQLESTDAGCRWLLDRWNELGAILEEGRAWRAADRFKAIRLLRIHPINILDVPELTALLQACQVLDPRAGDLVNDMLEGLVPADSARSFEQLFEGRSDPSAPPDEAAARQQLLNVVRREIAKLEALIERHQKQDELEASLLQHRVAFDDSADGEMLRRYETTCSEQLFRILNDLSKRRVEKGSDSAPSPAERRTFLPTWFKPPIPAVDSRGTIDGCDQVETCNPSDRAGTAAPAERSPSSTSGPVARTERILQNEALSALLVGPHHEGGRKNLGASPARGHGAARRGKIAGEKHTQIAPN